MRTARWMLVLAVTASAALAATAPAQAGWFSFHRITNTGSELVWKWTSDTGRLYTSPTWRAGSGTSTVCSEIGRGWLPVGWYDTWGHWNHYDGRIKGRVIYLQNKRCADGTPRTELFIHTEETAGNGQYCPYSSDDPYCWEGWFDYKSAGCIKVSYPRGGWPDDIGSVHWYWHNRGGSSSHGSYTLDNRLYVHD